VVQVLDTLSTFLAARRAPTHPTEGNDTLGAGFLRYIDCATKASMVGSAVGLRHADQPLAPGHVSDAWLVLPSASMVGSAIGLRYADQSLAPRPCLRCIACATKC
jgi:hypothetical protein